jgi:hypothetical protein
MRSIRLAHQHFIHVTIALFVLLPATVLANGGYAADRRHGVSSFDNLRSSSTFPDAIADFDGDKNLDFVTVHMEGSEAKGSLYRIELNLADGAAARSGFLVTARGGGLQITPRDVDGDHDLDLVITTRFSNEPVGVWINDGRGGFSEADPAKYANSFSQEPDTIGAPRGGSPLHIEAAPSRNFDPACPLKSAAWVLAASNPSRTSLEAGLVLRISARHRQSRAPPTSLVLI